MHAPLISEKFSHRCLCFCSNVHMIDDGPFSSFQKRWSSASSFYASLFQAIDCAMSTDGVKAFSAFNYKGQSPSRSFARRSSVVRSWINTTRQPLGVIRLRTNHTFTVTPYQDRKQDTITPVKRWLTGCAHNSINSKHNQAKRVNRHISIFTFHLFTTEANISRHPLRRI